MQGAALASSLGFALVGGTITGGWRETAIFCHSKIYITFEQTSYQFSYFIKLQFVLYDARWETYIQ